MECAWISNFVILETEALLTFCQEEHGVGSERARAGAGLKAGFLRQKNIRTKEVCANKNILFFCPNFCGVRVERAHRVQKEAPSYRRERPKGRGCARALRGLAQAFAYETDFIFYVRWSVRGRDLRTGS